MGSINDRATTFKSLHTDPTLLQMVNVWDVISAKVIADLPETKALATAGHSIAAAYGYPDGQIPRDTMIEAVGRIAAATELPVSADLDDGYDDAGETIRRAIGVGIVGANVEDRLKPLAESVAVMEAIVAAGEAEGVDFVLNARTDAFVRGKDRPSEVNVADAIERGRAFLEAGATTVFVPGNYGADVVETLVDGLGDHRLAVIGFPALPPPVELERLRVARITYGPLTQRVALAALHAAAENLQSGGTLPADLPALN